MQLLCSVGMVIWWLLGVRCLFLENTSYQSSLWICWTCDPRKMVIFVGEGSQTLIVILSYETCCKSNQNRLEKKIFIAIWEWSFLYNLAASDFDLSLERIIHRFILHNKIVSYVVLYFKIRSPSICPASRLLCGIFLIGFYSPFKNISFISSRSTNEDG